MFSPGSDECQPWSDGDQIDATRGEMEAYQAQVEDHADQIFLASKVGLVTFPPLPLTLLRRPPDHPLFVPLLLLALEQVVVVLHCAFGGSRHGAQMAQIYRGDPLQHGKSQPVLHGQGQQKDAHG